MSEIPPLEPASQPAEGLPVQAPPPPPAPPMLLPPAAPRRSRAGIWILAILLALSVLVNLVLLVVQAIRLDLDVATRAGRPLQTAIVTYAETRDAVAVIHVDGLITDAPLRGWGASGTDCALVKQQVDQALGDEHVKAVVLKVDSPGGSASASDMMLHELKRLSVSKKPVVAHMGSVAASGGYYVSMGAERIVAQPTCITGSIGVMGQVINFQDLMGDKLGIKVYTFKSGDYKDVGNPFRSMTEEEKRYLQDTLIAPMYERFLKVVEEGRPKMKPDRIRELADGRIYTAQQAVDNGLVDKIGFFEDAVVEAKKLANLKEARVIEYHRQMGLLDFLSVSAQAKSAPLIDLSPDTVNAWSTPRIMMLWQGQ